MQRRLGAAKQLFERCAPLGLALGPQVLAVRGQILPSTLEDITRLRRASPLVDEVVVGKALYEKRFTLQAAMAAGR